MSNLNLVCLSFKECHLLPQMISTLSGIIGSPISQMKIDRDLEQFQNKERGQYDAARILDHFEQRAEKLFKKFINLINSSAYTLILASIIKVYIF